MINVGKDTLREALSTKLVEMGCPAADAEAMVDNVVDAASDGATSALMTIKIGLGNFGQIAVPPSVTHMAVVVLLGLLEKEKRDIEAVLEAAGHAKHEVRFGVSSHG